MREYDELKKEIGDSQETKEDVDNTINKKCKFAFIEYL